MPGLLYTVENLTDEVRSMLDEENRDSIDTDVDILPALNRGQDYAYDIYARRYPEPILTHSVLALSGGVQEYDLPEDIFEDRILKLEIAVPAGNGRFTYREVLRISYSQISNYESASVSNTPSYYCVVGRKIRFPEPPSGTYSARIWFLRNPEKLVSPQGRITRINTASNYVVVDQAGSNMTTESDQLGSYVNVIDGQTGVIKGTFQIQTLEDNRVVFRSVPNRSSVLNRTVDTDIADISVNEDDYLSAVDGTCVPFYGRPTCNFLIEYAVAELTRKLGGEAGLEAQVLDKFEKQIEKTFVGREVTARIQKRNTKWGIPTRRTFWES